MKKELIVLLSILAWSCNFAENAVSQITGPEVEPASKDSVLSGFMLQPEELFFQRGWHVSSLDRMSVMLDSDLFGRYGPPPAFYMDDIPFNPSFFGVTYIQHFPVPIHHLKSSHIAAHSGFSRKGGLPMPAGLVDIKSERMKAGLSVFGAAQLGHHTGEPGPWAYDPESVSPNIERSGPWLDGGFSLKFGNWYTKGIAKTQKYDQFNNFVQNRIIHLRSIPEEELWLGGRTRNSALLVETGLETDHLTIRLRGNYAQGEDFLFFQPLAREIPSELQDKQLSGLIKWNVAGSLGIRLLGYRNEKSIGYRRHRFSHNFDFLEINDVLETAVFNESGRIKANLGFKINNRNTTAPGYISDNHRFISLFFDNNMKLFQHMNVESSVSVKQNSSQKRSWTTTAGASFGIFNWWRLQFEAAYAELLPEEANDIDYLVLNGYEIFKDIGILPIYPEKIELSRSRSLTFHSHFSPSKTSKIKAGFNYIEYLSAHIPFQYAQYNLDFSTLPGTYILWGNRRGRYGIADVEASHQLHATLMHSIKVMYRKFLSGNDQVEQYRATSPAVQMHYEMHYKPFPDLEFLLRTQWITEREWIEYETLDGQLNRTYHSQYPYQYFEFKHTLPQQVKVDISISKWFWEQRLRAVLQMQNMLNQPWQLHPIGIVEGFGYLARIEVRF